MNRLFTILCMLVATRAGADTLSDMRAAVARLSAKQPVRGTFATEQLVKSAGRFANGNTARNVSADVTHDGAGVSIAIPQALIDKVSKARHGGDESAINLIGAIRSINVVEAIDFREPFLEMLEGATVTGEARGAFHGRPARKLSLKLVPKDASKDAGSMQIGTVKADDQVSLWIGDDDLPIAAERVMKTTAGFLFVHGTFAAKLNYTFAHTADRLVLARLETTDSGSGMGQKVEKTAVQTMTLH
jgi:hypothetical protein